MIWLGEKRGNLSDWTTQVWVRATGREVSLAEIAWLAGPTGGTRRIGMEFFDDYARREKRAVVEGGVRGLIPDFDCLRLPGVAEGVREFYEQTSEFELDAWSAWHGMFRPFGKALSLIFSSRLQQLNVPLSPLDSARGMTSRVLQMQAVGAVTETAWVRELNATGMVIYAGSYSVCEIPGCKGPCVKVVFPLPNGRAIILMKTEALGDGSVSLRSMGAGLDDPGFYFVVQANRDAPGRDTCQASRRRFGFTLQSPDRLGLITGSGSGESNFCASTTACAGILLRRWVRGSGRPAAPRRSPSAPPPPDRSAR